MGAAGFSEGIEPAVNEQGESRFSRLSLFNGSDIGLN